MTLARTATERDLIRKAALAKPRRRRPAAQHDWTAWSTPGQLCTTRRRTCQRCGRIQTRPG